MHSNVKVCVNIIVAFEKIKLVNKNVHSRPSERHFLKTSLVCFEKYFVAVW